MGRREAEAASLLARARAELESAQARAAETMARARADSERLLGDVRRAVNEEWERLRRADKSRAALEQSRRRLRDAARAAAPVGAELAGGWPAPRAREIAWRWHISASGERC